jgi:hypothetical protein
MKTCNTEYEGLLPPILGPPLWFANGDDCS